MKRITRLFLLMILLAGTQKSFAQLRYLNPIFAESDISITYNVPYGVNYSFLTGSPVLDTLKLDLYQPPVADTASARPIIIYVHTGNFLPAVTNGSPVGNKFDSTSYNLCKQWAERGYVAASINYRLGWNPVSTDPEVRRGTLLNAVYLALLDVKNAVRFFKYSADSISNPYKIDKTKIILFGEGSGGYVTLAYGALDNFGKISSLSKFRNAVTGFAYVDTTINGNIDGFGGSLNRDNYKGVDSHVGFITNVGGALADTSWLGAGQPPVVSFQCVRDPFAPYGYGTVIVPTTNEDVVDVAGSGAYMSIINGLHNNDVFATKTFTDPFTLAARGRYNQNIPYILPAPNDMINTGSGEGLYPFVFPVAASKLQNQASPWQFWDPSSPQGSATVAGSNPAITTSQASFNSNPDMSRTKALTYMDTIQNYLLPRVIMAFSLPGYQTVGINEPVTYTGNLSIYPNPATASLTVSVQDNQSEIAAINMFDITGRLVKAETVNNTGKYSIARNGLVSGVYFLNVRFSNGTQSNTKVVFE